MRFKNLALTAVVMGLAIAPAMAQTAGKAPSGQVFNGTSSPSGGGAPVFVAPPKTVVNSQPYNGPKSQAPISPAKTEAQIIARNKQVAAQNDAAYAQKKQASQAKYAGYTAAAQQKKEAQMKAAQAGNKGRGGKDQAAVAETPAYTGPVVFTGNKKTSDKPARLFNVQ